MKKTKKAQIKTQTVSRPTVSVVAAASASNAGVASWATAATDQNNKTMADKGIHPCHKGDKRVLRRRFLDLLFTGLDITTIRFLDK